MFTNLLAAICWPSDDAGLVTDVSLAVSDSPYVVRYLHSTKAFLVSNGVPSTVVPGVVNAGRHTVVAPSATMAAHLILVRELKRRGLTRQPKIAAVNSLATVVHGAVRDALNTREYDLSVQDSLNEG